MPQLQPERRQVLKAGAIAWTVPVVAMATAAPAYATSGSNMSTSSATATLENFVFQRVETTIVLRNSGSGPTTALTITISIAGQLVAQGSQPSAPTGWTLTGINSGTNTATFTRIAQLGAGSGETVTFALRRNFSIFADAVNATVIPGGGGVGTTLTLTNVGF